MTHRTRVGLAVAGATLTFVVPVMLAAQADTGHRLTVPPGASVVEQRMSGMRDAIRIVEQFDGLGDGFTGPHGRAALRNPSDNTLAVGHDHIVQIVNTRLAVFSRKGARFESTGRVLHGPVHTNTVFHGAGGACEARNNGDAVVRYDQLADRWLIVMPIFYRSPARPDDPPAPRPGVVTLSATPYPSQPGAAVPLYVPAPVMDSVAVRVPPSRDSGAYAMCYAVSATADPLGAWYRYEFTRPLFPDYPRPAVWPDGYYTGTSTGDEVIEKHVCIADRVRMLRGEAATEQCVVIPGVNFLNNVDLDGTQLPPPGAPNLMLAAGGSQLTGHMVDSVLQLWSVRVNWADPSRTQVTGPTDIRVAPYRYQCDGQLTSCVPQPGTDRRLDSQGDKLMARVVYRRRGAVESIVASHSVNTSAGSGGVRWYELRVGSDRRVTVAQQGTYVPDSSYRWLPSPAMDRFGNIGIGYSFGGTPSYPGQRFAGRLRTDPAGTLPLREVVLVEGQGSQTTTLRWEDYTQTAIDPRDDCTIWYVGDYLRAGASAYSSRIGAFRLPGCTGVPLRRGRTPR